MRKMLAVATVAIAAWAGAQTVQSTNRYALFGPSYSEYSDVVELVGGGFAAVGKIGGDMIVAGFNAAAVRQWSHVTPGPYGTMQPMTDNGIVRDSLNNIYTFGVCNIYGRNACIVTSYTPTGTQRWQRVVNTIYSGPRFTCDPTGNVYVLTSNRLASFSPTGTLRYDVALADYNVGSAASLVTVGNLVYTAGSNYDFTLQRQVSRVVAYNAADGTPAWVINLTGTRAQALHYNGANIYLAVTDSPGHRILRLLPGDFTTVTQSDQLTGYVTSMAASVTNLFVAGGAPDRVRRHDPTNLITVSSMPSTGIPWKIALTAPNQFAALLKFNSSFLLGTDNTMTSYPTSIQNYNFAVSGSTIYTVGTKFNDAAVQRLTTSGTVLDYYPHAHEGNLRTDDVPQVAVAPDGAAYFGATVYTQPRHYFLRKLARNGTPLWTYVSPMATRRLQGLVAPADGSLWAFVTEATFNTYLVRHDPNTGAMISQTPIANLGTNFQLTAMTTTPGFVDLAFKLSNPSSLRVIRYRSNGALYFNRGIASTGRISADKILYAPNGDLVLSGDGYSGTINGRWLARISGTGVIRWQRHISEPNVGSDFSDFALDAAGNAIIVYQAYTNPAAWFVRRVDVAGTVGASVNLFNSPYGDMKVGVSPRTGRISVFASFPNRVLQLNPANLATLSTLNVTTNTKSLYFDTTGNLFLAGDDLYTGPTGSSVPAIGSTRITDGNTLGGTRRVAGATGDFPATTYRAVPGVGSDLWILGSIRTATQGETVSLSRLIQPQTPVANANSYAIPAGTTTTIAAPGVLANDTDANGDPLTAVIVTPPNSAQLTATVNSNGSLRLTPRPGFTGTTTFTYRAVDYDGYQSAPATVTITVN